MNPQNSPSVAKPHVVKDILGRHGFRFKKQLGQNFLIDERVLDAIVNAAELTASDGAFEVGPGAGVVTQRLAHAAGRVVAVEKDKSLAPVLADTLQGLTNIDLLFGDVLEMNLADTWARFDGCSSVSVIANLPYYVTTPIMFHLFESAVPVSRMVLMVQKEVADRLTAKPGGKDYGALTVAVAYRAKVEKVVNVSPSSFLPSPGVDSVVVRLRFHSEPPVDVQDESMMFRVVRAAFGMRRKTLENALAGGLALQKESVRAALEAADINPSRRGETLSIAEFARLSDRIQETIH